MKWQTSVGIDASIHGFAGMSDCGGQKQYKTDSKH